MAQAGFLCSKDMGEISGGKKKSTIGVCNIDHSCFFSKICKKER